ncbi:MAG TPA: TMEM175 family protein [Nitrososphaeraceae archaeon]|nr:TMEM175 family protein [Nitrososphaeraceae archaeon]
MTTERLKTLGDSILLVSLTLLAYNLVPPSVVNGQLNADEVKNFLDNLYGLISSFFVIIVFWVIYTKILDYLKESNEIVVWVSLTFFILVLLTPVFSVALFQYQVQPSITSLASLQIVNGILLVLLWIYLLRHRNMMTIELKKNDNRYMYSILSVIPSLYAISIGIAFINIQMAIIFPVIMVPTMMLLGQAFHHQKKG